MKFGLARQHGNPLLKHNHFAMRPTLYMRLCIGPNYEPGFVP